MFILVSILFVGCTSQDIELNETNYTQNNVTLEAKVIVTESQEIKAYSLTEIENIFKLNNLTIQDTIEPFYEIIQAQNGTKYQINNITIEVYEYDPLNMSMMESYKDSLSNNESYIFSQNNILILIHSTDNNTISFYEELFN